MMNQRQVTIKCMYPQQSQGLFNITAGKRQLRTL